MTLVTPLEEKKLKTKLAKAAYYQETKEARLAQARIWKKANPDKVKLSNKKSLLKATYGLDWETFEGMFKDQDGQCAICKGTLNFYGDKTTHMSDACVDHCHTTGKVRGLLCKNCNLGLGHFQDTPLFLEQAIQYLKGK